MIKRTTSLCQGISAKHSRDNLSLSPQQQHLQTTAATQAACLADTAAPFGVLPCFCRQGWYLQALWGSSCSADTSRWGAGQLSGCHTRSQPCGPRRSRRSAAAAAARTWWWWWPPSRCSGQTWQPPPASCQGQNRSANLYPPEEKENHHI